jgi:hypothetical protein
MASLYWKRREISSSCGVRRKRVFSHSARDYLCHTIAPECYTAAHDLDIQPQDSLGLCGLTRCGPRRSNQDSRLFSQRSKRLNVVGHMQMLRCFVSSYCQYLLQRGIYGKTFFFLVIYRTAPLVLIWMLLSIDNKGTISTPQTAKTSFVEADGATTAERDVIVMRACLVILILLAAWVSY